MIDIISSPTTKLNELEAKLEQLEILLSKDATKEEFAKIEDLESLRQEIVEFKESIGSQVASYVNHKLENQTNEKFSWDKFTIGLAKVGITESTIISIIILALTQTIQYLETININDNLAGALPFIPFIIILLKSIKQTFKKKA